VREHIGFLEYRRNLMGEIARKCRSRHYRFPLWYSLTWFCDGQTWVGKRARYEIGSEKLWAKSGLKCAIFTPKLRKFRLLYQIDNREVQRRHIG
jgi:hypothetical protein